MGGACGDRRCEDFRGQKAVLFLTDLKKGSDIKKKFIRKEELVFPNMESSFLSSYFSRKQYVDKSELANFGSELDSITEIGATRSSRKRDKQTPAFYKNVCSPYSLFP